MSYCSRAASVRKEERSGRNFSFVADKRKPNFLSSPLLWTVPVQYTAASLSHTLTDESLHVPALHRALKLNFLLGIGNETFPHSLDCFGWSAFSFSKSVVAL